MRALSIAQVPLLQDALARGQLESLHGRLVRLQAAFVTETLDPEIYMGGLQLPDGSWHCTKYGNSANAVSNVRKCTYFQRQPVVVRALPGRSTWCGDDTASQDAVTAQLADIRLEAAHGAPPLSTDAAVVLLHDAAAAEVKLHDVLEVVGVVDALRHVDEGTWAGDDEFADLVAAENAGDDDNDENADANGDKQQLGDREAEALVRVHAVHVRCAPSMHGPGPYAGLQLKHSMQAALFKLVDHGVQQRRFGRNTPA